MDLFESALDANDQGEVDLEARRMENSQRILVVNRMSEYSREAFKTGVVLARKFGSELQVLHLISHPALMLALNTPVPFPDETKNYASAQDEAKEDLDKIISKEIGAGLPIKIIIREGNVVDEIVQVVKEEKINLMVLLSHEEGRLEHMLFGHDNDVLIRRLPCSILLVKKEPEPVDW